MGKIAKKYCRKIFITDDNPRNENPKKIRDEIIKGCKKLAKNVGNRKDAIKKGIKELKSNEILLVAGKGHEKTQDYGNIVKVFSDKKVIKEIVKRRIKPRLAIKATAVSILVKGITTRRDEVIQY